MRSRTPLALMEIMLLILVFAFVSAVCIRVFVTADKLSRQSEARDYAVVTTQSAAELLRHNGGNFAAAARELDAKTSGDTLRVDYDGEWKATESNGQYMLIAERMPSGIPGLGKAQVRTLYENGEELFSVDIMWQEDGTNAQQ